MTRRALLSRPHPGAALDLRLPRSAPRKSLSLSPNSSPSPNPGHAEEGAWHQYHDVGVHAGMFDSPNATPPEGDDPRPGVNKQHGRIGISSKKVGTAGVTSHV